MTPLESRRSEERTSGGSAPLKSVDASDAARTPAAPPPQEHLALLRRMAAAMPAVFPDLAALTDANEDLDFFVNVAHLQLHRRTRALGRLTKVFPPPLH